MTTAPVLAFPTPVIRSSRSTRAHISTDELLAVLKVARARSTRDWAMILLAYRHGLRASEVCGLRMADIDVKRQSIIVRRLKGSLETVQPLYSHRGMPLLDELGALRAWLRDRKADWLGFRIRVAERRPTASQCILSRISIRRRSCRTVGRQTTSARSETLACVAFDRWQRQPRPGEAMPRPPEHH